MKYFKEIEEEELRDIFITIDYIKERLLKCEYGNIKDMYLEILQDKYEKLSNYYIGGVN